MGDNGTLRIAIYIDGPNLKSYLYDKRIRLSFEKLLRHLEGIKHLRDHRAGKIVLRKYFFDVTSPLRNNDGTADFLRRECDFEIIKVLKKKFSRECNRELHKEFKSLTDQAITVSIMDDIWNKRFDVIVLVSGDSDYTRVLRYCKEEKRARVEVCFWSTATAQELRQVADLFIDLGEHGHLLC